MTYTVLIKYRSTELIVEGPLFDSRKKAEKWVDRQMTIWEEERAFKIVELKEKT